MVIAAFFARTWFILDLLVVSLDAVLISLLGRGVFALFSLGNLGDCAIKSRDVGWLGV